MSAERSFLGHPGHTKKIGSGAKNCFVIEVDHSKKVGALIQKPKYLWTGPPTGPAIDLLPEFHPSETQSDRNSKHLVCSIQNQDICLEKHAEDNTSTQNVWHWHVSNPELLKQYTHFVIV